MNKIAVAILVRVSTTREETTRQLAELQEYAEKRNYNVVEVCHDETISGSAKEDERRGLRRAEELAREGQINKEREARGQS